MAGFSLHFLVWLIRNRYKCRKNTLFHQIILLHIPALKVFRQYSNTPKTRITLRLPLFILYIPSLFDLDFETSIVSIGLGCLCVSFKWRASEDRPYNKCLSFVNKVSWLRVIRRRRGRKQRIVVSECLSQHYVYSFTYQNITKALFFMISKNSPCYSPRYSDVIMSIFLLCHCQQLSI